MRYASIRNMDISNGEGVGVSLFVQGCHFHCKNCFNTETWDFSGGKEWTPEVKKKFLELTDKPYIKRISLLGGECLAEENLDDILDLVNEIRLLYPNKSIWIYSGYTWDECNLLLKGLDEYCITYNKNNKKRQQIISQCDVMIDGKYIDSQRDIALKWRGSSNQRVIDVKKTLLQNRIILYCD